MVPLQIVNIRNKCLKLEIGAEGMTRMLRAQAAQDLGLHPSVHMDTHSHVSSQSQGILQLLLASTGTVHAYMMYRHTCRHTNSYTHQA